jgi:hypothetical protein
MVCSERAKGVVPVTMDVVPLARDAVEDMMLSVTKHARPCDVASQEVGNETVGPRVSDAVSVR